MRRQRNRSVATYAGLFVALMFLFAACTNRTPIPTATPTPTQAAPPPPSTPVEHPPEPPATPTPTPVRVTLQVAFAANLSAAIPALTKAYEDKTGIGVTPVVSSSGNLARQIANGAPYDVFVSADEGYVDDLIAQGYLDAQSKRIYAFGRLALVVSTRAGLRVTTLAGLAAPEVKRIAIANPQHAPYGRAAKQAMERAGIWPLVKERVIFGETVRQALQFVQSGNAMAGVVAYSVANVPEVEFYPVREDLYDPIAQAVGIVSRTRHPQAARMFVAFLTGPEGRAILSRYGYLFPEGEQ